MIKTIQSDDLMPDLIKILHLPEGTVAFTIHCERGRTVCIDVKLLPDSRMGVITKIKKAFINAVSLIGVHNASKN